MGKVKQMDIKNRTYYFYNDITDIKDFWCNVFKNWQKIIQKHWYLQHWIHHEENNSWLWKNLQLNPLYLLIDHSNGYIEEKGVNKYLVFEST